MNRNILISFLSLASAVLALGQTAPGSAAPTASSPDEAFAKGTFSLDERLRWEYADQANLKDANAFTLRTLFGYTTESFDGIQGMIEGGNTAAINPENDYSAAGTNPGGAGRANIPDPPATYLNQAWVSYAADRTVIKIGRQRLNLDDARFVGDSNWRQKMQTFDSATLTSAPYSGVSLFYGYVWHVSRVYGNQTGQPDFDSRSSLLNASYAASPYAKFTAYGYLLDFGNSAANSSNTFGGIFSGEAPISDGFKVAYRGEAASQSGADNNPVRYTADYYRADLGVVAKLFDAGLGYEELGSDKGIKGFATPLATLHIFNGWDNEFLTTPAHGLRDSFASVGVNLPEGVPVKLIYHDFKSDYADQAYGHEWDGVVTHKIGKHWAFLVKAGRFYGAPLNRPTPFFSTKKVWLQTEYSF